MVAVLWPGNLKLARTTRKSLKRWERRVFVLISLMMSVRPWNGRSTIR